MGKYRTRELTQRVRYALLAGVAGAFLIPQVAAAAPTGEHDMTNGVTVGRAATASGTGTDTNITATAANNVIKWADYSVKQGETVNYDGKNYLNIVTGGNTSAINGAIKNTGGDVYLVNPNGVIFGKTASVNVGNLYVSTQEESTLNMTAFTGSGNSPLSTTVTDVGKADVVNMGSITANKVEVYGRSIRILDAANVHDATTSPVILHIDEETNGGYAHIGYQSGSVPSTSDYEIHKKVTPTTPPSSPPTTVVAAATAADNYYQLVSTPTEFQNINSDLTKNYMLANDIDFYDSATGTKKPLTPIGGDSHAAFSGKFDGNFFRIQNFTVSGTSRAGAFGEINGARIDNVGITGATITGGTTSADYAGGVVGYATSSTLKNVYSDRGTTVSGANGRHGGIVGYTTDTKVESVYSKATIGAGGGIIGLAANDTKVRDSYSEIHTTATTGGGIPLAAYFIYYINPTAGTTVDNSYFIGGNFSYSNITSKVNNTYKVTEDADHTYKASLLRPGSPTATTADEKDANSSDTYAAWGNTINNTGAPGAKWRIYEGRTLPLLTAFMDGTATATYDTRYFNANGTLNTESANTAKSNKGADIETTYNSQYVKIVGKDTSGADVVGGKSNVVTYTGAMQYNADGTPNLDHIYDYVSTAGTHDFDKTNGIRNAGTKAILWSDQDGPNLRGVNVTVKQREVRLDNGSIKPDRMYNGKSDVTDAFIGELKKGSINSSGFTTEDINAHSVNLDFTTGHFKAQAYNLEYEDATGTTIAAGTHADKNVGKDKPVKFTGSIGFSGDDAANYTFNNASLSNITGTATITKAPLYLKINKTTADAKIYDGTDAVLDHAMKQTGTSTPNITLNKDNYAPASTVPSPTHHKGEIMLDDGDNPDDVDLTQVTDPTYTDTTGAKQIHVGDHNLQYKNVGLRGADAGNYDLYLPPIPAVGNGNKVVGNTVYLDGKIIAREITRDSFNVYNKTTHAPVTAQKVYDGNDEYTPDEGVYLSTNALASGDTGIVSRDQGHITFALTDGKGHFTNNTGTRTKNVKEATKLAYEVTGQADTHTDTYGGHLLSDYYVLDTDNTTKRALSDKFHATGDGKITPKALTATVVSNHITKVYDAKQNQTDGNRNDIIGDALVTLSGFVSGETRTNTSTAMYASPNVAWDNAANAPTSQAVTYTAKFDRGTGAEADNYTLDPTAHTTTVTNSASVSGSYTGTITPRDLKLTFGDVTKVYDGTADNATKNVTALDDGLSGAVTTADGTTAASISAAALSSATSSYGDFSGTTFNANRNAGSRAVEYVGLAGALGTNHNYAIADKQYGKGTITRRRIDPSGFQVRKDGTIANASKVYDGTDISDLPSGASLVTPTATSGNTGIVVHDEGKITFKLKDGTSGYYSSDRDGNNHTSHVSEAHYVAYDIVAHTSDDTNNPLSNYTFGSAAAEAAGTLKNLENITNATPAHVTADGSITPAALHAQTHSIEKVYDGLAAHTDGNRAAVANKDTIITFTGWVTTHNGITEKRTNNSSAVYQAGHSVGAKDVAYDMDGITTKDVTYTAALTGNYADDYKIVDITCAGAATATTGVTTTVADAGKITPRALKIVMDDVSKTYDGNAKNTTVSVKEITDTIGSAVIDDILSDDNVTALDLTNQYTAKMTAAPDNYKSTYGRGNTDATFVENVNASNGTPHDVQYTNMRKAFNEEFGTFSAGNYSVEKNVYGKGTINRRNIDPNNFDVVDDHNVTSHATKEYDGTTTYNVPTGWKLNPSTGPSTGVIAGDDVTFHLTSDGAQFTTAAHHPTPNAYDAAKVMYNVVASGDREKIKNYTLGGRKLEDGKAKVYGEGKITRRVLRLALVNNTDINKVYDGQTGVVDTDTKRWTALKKTDARGNVAYTAGSKELVNDGSSFRIVANYRNSANTADDKNVAYDAATPRNIIDKAIEYNIQIAGTGDARNYAFANGTSTPTNAESGLKLSATGKITPKDLSGAFEKVTKVYDGTKNVPAADVKFKKGADGVIDGDNITFTHSEEFQSANVNGDDNHTWTPTEGPEKGKVQKNWINYSGLTLGGTSADNYTINATAVGLGEITPLELNPSTVTLVTTQATKEYDGGVKVKKDGSDAISAIKNYITDATVTVGGSPVSVLPDLELQSAEYDTKNVVGGPQPRVTYHMKYKGTSGNFTLAPGAATFDGKGKGVITPKDVTATIKGPLTKVYDATANTIGAAKNATTGAAVVTADDLVKFVGLVAGDGATNATTATFDNKNVGTNKTVTYDIKLDTASAGNYNIKYNGSAITAPIPQAGNTITKRKVNVTFGEQHKSYDGLSKNTSIDASVSAADAAVLNSDVTGLAVADKLTNLAATGATPNIISNYGKRTGTGFTPDANAGTNKDVQYAGLSAAMNTSLGGNAGNYEFDTDGYGKGYIERATINVNDPSFTFTANNAEKVYDGTNKVLWKDPSSGIYYGDNSHVKNYISTIGVTLNGNWVDLSGSVVMDLTGTKYSSPNATNGTPDTVTYKFRLNTNNIIVNGGTNEFTKTANGTIDRRVVNVALDKDAGIDKIYDANAKLIDTNTRHYDKFIDDDARGNVIYAAGIANDNKLVRTANGATVNDGAKMTITANYVDDLTNRAADKNVARDTSGAVTAKGIAYNVRIDAANGGKNYTLDHNGTTANAEDGLKMNASGTITPRAMTLGFADVDKPYDTTATNNTKTINSVMAGNSDGRGAATLAADNITSATFGSATGSVNSLYGAVDTDATFHSDPNVVTDADGNVVERGKDVQYTNVWSVLTGALANNYTVADTAYGKGTIRKRSVTANDFRFNISNATKMYDGTKDVEYVENGQTYKDLAHVKKRFQNSKLDLGGNLVDINLEDIDLTGAAYNDERVAHANGVNYDVTINTKNFEFTGSRNRTINHTGDTITKRDLATKLPPHLIKEYDGEDTFTETNEIFANAMARANLTGVVDRDKNNIQLKVKGTYSSPDASVETRADAEARIPATAGRDVAYELTLSGDADTLLNYKIGTVETLDSNGEMKGNGSGKADIYKKTLTVSADPIDKVYDGTRTVVRPNGSTTAPHPAANKLKLNGFAKSADHFDFDQTAADKIDGLYSDPNVSRAADGTILDKDIAYSGVKAAFKNYADNHAGSAARNYRVDSDTVSGKGKITPRTITPNDIANGLRFAEASKVYDGTRAVKHGGLNTPDALKNYLTSATVNINGTPIDINKKELTIRADEASTHYDTANVAGGAQPRVTYTLNYTGGNFDITGPITKTANGVITKRQVTAYAPGQLTKEYDGTPKVYDSGDPTIKTYYRGNQVTSGADIVQLEEENGDRGLLTNDGVQNISTAMFRDKNAGTRKVVDYNIAVDAAHAGNYELVDRRGNVISQTSTNNNTITPRHLDITFGDVRRAYDGTSTNTDVTALVKDSDARATLRRDGVNLSGEQLRLRDAANNDITLPSDYGYGRTDSAFTKNADANQTGEPPKDVQYRKLGDAMRTLLGNDAGNYYFDETGYGKGRITKASVRESDFRLKFGDAVKEYDGTPDVHNAAQYLDKTASHATRTVGGTPSTITLTDDDYVSVDGKYDNKNAGDPTVRYKVQISNKNFDFGTWDGIVGGDGDGHIDKRKLIADPSNYLTKEYDGTAEIIGKARNAQGTLITTGGDNLVKFHHYGGTPTHPDDGEDTVFYKDAAAGTVSNNTTADYVDKNVEWQGGVWNQGRGVVGDKNVNYSFAINGTGANNYETVDANGTAVTAAQGKGKITPKEIVLKADPQERWINEGLPTSYTGTPMGENLSHNEVPEIVPSDTPLPGTIDYSSPNARLRVGYYAVNGTYKAQGGADGDTVSRNYRFVEDPANDTALYIGPYIPDYEYYKAMTQVSKMTPDEYAYENASLDRTNHYSRKPTAQVDPVPPAINVVKDGVDIRQNDINVLDDTVYTIVDEVFG
ncbi:YDG domain-containing protein [uncultured Selenomonas sp.]|uniref:YDG domain-containing protein n=1 Tax=uncultured Selenomonas sp. TaxID=159275 RepID=UPI0028DC8319|nr:YDG domain-containing protein [uncultured Selenomonas sp.]